MDTGPIAALVPLWVLNPDTNISTNRQAPKTTNCPRGLGGAGRDFAFSQQMLRLKSPSEHSGNTREFTNQFTKLAWLEIMLLWVDRAERHFFNL